MESSQWENWNHLFCRKVSFLAAPHSQFRGVCQGMKQTYPYLWYPLFQAKWDRCDQRNPLTYNYLVKGHHLYSGTWNCRIGLASFHFSWEAPVWNLPHANKGKYAVMYLYVRGIDFPSFCDLSICFWNCSDGVVFFCVSFYYFNYHFWHAHSSWYISVIYTESNMRFLMIVY
jgi:hypothetical protein